ncbi:MAG: carbohydrate-binding family 9-like protein [Bryobacterales bacterium]|nr:carbohydrate-binding family 9-like protein [Bryobacterales bacterium]
MRLWIVLLPVLALAADSWTQPSLQIYRTATPIKVDGVLDEPAWMAAPVVRLREFPWWKSGEKERTVVKLLWDDQNLYLAHIGEDAHIAARHADRDGKIPEDDCFELMIMPDPANPQRYFNLEWNVIGGLVDNFRPNGPKQPRAARWDAEGVQVKGTYRGTLNDDTDRDQYWEVEVAIPFSNFKEFAPTPPQTGSYWLGNLNRHGGKTNVQFSQWSAGDTPVPSFHTPHRFGKLIFSGKVSPFDVE